MLLPLKIFKIVFKTFLQDYVKPNFRDDGVIKAMTELTGIKFVETSPETINY